MSGCINVLGRNGDTEQVWTPEDAEAVARAQKFFDEHIKLGPYVAFAMDAEGKGGHQVREFDPGAGRIILTPVVGVG